MHPLRIYEKDQNFNDVIRIEKMDHIYSRVVKGKLYQEDPLYSTIQDLTPIANKYDKVGFESKDTSSAKKQIRTKSNRSKAGSTPYKLNSKFVSCRISSPDLSYTEETRNLSSSPSAIVEIRSTGVREKTPFRKSFVAKFSTPKDKSKRINGSRKTTAALNIFKSSSSLSLPRAADQQVGLSIRGEIGHQNENLTRKTKSILKYQSRYKCDTRGVGSCPQETIGKENKSPQGLERGDICSQNQCHRKVARGLFKSREYAETSLHTSTQRTQTLRDMPKGLVPDQENEENTAWFGRFGSLRRKKISHCSGSDASSSGVSTASPQSIRSSEDGKYVHDYASVFSIPVFPKSCYVSGSVNDLGLPCSFRTEQQRHRQSYPSSKHHLAPRDPSSKHHLAPRDPSGTVQLRHKQTHTSAPQPLAPRDSNGTVKLRHRRSQPSVPPPLAPRDSIPVIAKPKESSVTLLKTIKLDKCMKMSKWISGIAITKKSEIIVTNMREAFLLDENGNLKRQIGAKGSNRLKEPTGVSVLSNGNLVLSDPTDQTVMIFTTKGQFLRKVDTSDLTNMTGVACNEKREIFITGPDKQCFNVYSENDKLLYSISGGKDFEHPCSIAICPLTGNTILGDDHKQMVISMSSIGKKILWTFSPSEPGNRGFFPSSICVDNLGYVFIADLYNEKVYMLDSCGKYLKTLLNRGGPVGLKGGPGAIAVDGKGHLFVADEEKTIKVFKYGENGFTMFRRFSVIPQVK